MSFKLPFGKKENDFPALPESNIPVSQVLAMRAQGMPNNQIANQLRASGFSLSQIRDAISQADIKSAVAPAQNMQGMPDMPGVPAMPDIGAMPQSQGMQNTPQFPAMPDVPAMPNLEAMPPVQNEPHYQDTTNQFNQQKSFNLPAGSLPAGKSMETLVDELQRIIENIIEEKWKGVEQKIGTLNTWKAKIEDKVGSLNSKVSELTSRIDGFSKTMVSKDEDYKKTMGDVNTEMEAIEKLMGKLVPSLAEEIKELRSVVEKMKKH